MKKWKELLTIVKAIYKKKPFIIIGSDLFLHKFGEFDDKMYSLEDYIMDFTYKKKLNDGTWIYYNRTSKETT